MKITHPILFCLFLAGCATSYQNVQDMEYAPNTWRISFNGNGFTSPQQAQDFALLRACDLTLKAGCRYFAIVNDSETITDAHFTTPGVANTYSSSQGTLDGTFSGNSFNGNEYSSGQSTTVYTPSRDIVFHNPHSNMYIVALTNELPNGSFDALFLKQQLSAHYHLNLTNSVP